MKKLLLVSMIVIGSFFIFAGVYSADSDILIVEVNAKPTSTHEWIKIWNQGIEPVDLEGWKFWEDNTNHKMTTSTTDSIMMLDEYGAVCQDADQFLFDHPDFAGSIFDSTWGSLNEEGEEIGLKNAAGEFVQKFVYSLLDESPTNTVSTSMISSSTEPVLPGVWSEIKINEFLSDPDSGNEWVELFNPSTSSLDVSSGYICDSRNTTSTCKQITGTAPANGWLLFDLQTNSYLNNSGDAVILKKPNGETIDQIIYNVELAPNKSQSLARKTDGIDTNENSDWAITTQPTPGAPNAILAPIIPQPVETVGVSTSTKSAATEKKTSSKPKNSTKTEEKIGLKWKIKYDPKVRVGEYVIFAASTTYDPRGGKILFSWNFDEGKNISGTVAEYVFVSSGLHNIIIHATSSAGTIDIKKLKVMVYPNGVNYGVGIIINEINPETDDEYIKIKNISTSTINVSNWQLMYNNKIYKIPTSTLVAPGEELIFYKEITGFTLNNSAGEVELIMPDDTLADVVGYGKNNSDEAVTSTKKESLVVTSSIITVSLSEARGLEKDQNVKVNGVVSVLPGVFGSQYFYISNGLAGIQVYQYKKDFPKLRVGDKINVTGITSEASGIKRIKIKDKNDIKFLSSGEASSSLYVLDDLNEDVLGNLVRVQGEITEIKTNYMYVDDSSSEAVMYFKNGAKIDKSKFKEGENVEVVGVLEQGKTDIQIWPRSQEDIKSIGLSQDLLKKQVVLEEEIKSVQNGDAKKYLIIAAIGVLAVLLGFLIKIWRKRSGS